MGTPGRRLGKSTRPQLDTIPCLKLVFVTSYTKDILLACGCIPFMAEAAEESYMWIINHTTVMSEGTSLHEGGSKAGL